MPAGYGTRCERCYWTATAERRIHMDRAAFAKSGLADEFGEFGTWLIRAVGPRRAALTIHRYLGFFEAIEKRWARIPPYEALLRHFGAEGLRRVRLPMRWLREEKGVETDPIARTVDSEWRRINRIMATVPSESAAGNALHAYKTGLLRKLSIGKTTIRSVRLALRPAANLLLRTSEEGGMIPEQSDVDRFLAESSGQRAAIKGFVEFLNSRHKQSISVSSRPPKNINEARKLNSLEKKVALGASKKPLNDSVNKEWILIAMVYFHGVRLKNRQLCNAAIQIKEKEITINVNEKKFYLPNPFGV